MQPGPYDWETAYFTTLVQEKKAVKTMKGVKHLRQGGRITALILKVTEGRTVYWSQVVPVSNSNWLFKGDSVAVPSVSVPLRIAETTGEGLPPFSESQPMKKRRTTQTKPSSSRISIPLPTTTSINLPRSDLAPQLVYPTSQPTSSNLPRSNLAPQLAYPTSSPSVIPFSRIRLTSEPDIPHTDPKESLLLLRLRRKESQTLRSKWVMSLKLPILLSQPIHLNHPHLETTILLKPQMQNPISFFTRRGR